MNQSWTSVEKPTNYKLIRCKWIYKIKEGDIKEDDRRYKARLVSKCFK